MTKADPADEPTAKVDPVEDPITKRTADLPATPAAPTVSTSKTAPNTAASSEAAGVDGVAIDAGAADSDAPTSDADADSSPGSRWRKIVAKRGEKKQRPFWIELPILIVVAFALTFVIQTFVAKVYYIPSGSMEQTLHGATEGGDRVLVNKVMYDFTDPAPGDVVVFRGPENWAPDVAINKPTTWYGKTFQALGAVVGIAPPDEKDFVKRVIATGGQTVMCCDGAGNVTVDGQPLYEPYIYENVDPSFGPGEDCSSASKSMRCFGPYTIPDNSLWVMGDHRGYSSDSAYGCRGQDEVPPISLCRGPISNDDVIGKAAFVVMPISRWQVIDDPDILQVPATVGMAASAGESAGTISAVGSLATDPAVPAAISFVGVFGVRLGTRGWIRRRRRRSES